MNCLALLKFGRRSLVPLYLLGALLVCPLLTRASDPALNNPPAASDEPAPGNRSAADHEPPRDTETTRDTQSAPDGQPATNNQPPREKFGPLLDVDGRRRSLYLNQPWNAGPLCGPNALYLLAKLEGHSASLDQLQKLVPVDPKAGCTLADLVRAAEAAGLTVSPRFVSDRELVSISPPYILHLAAAENQPQHGHFVVVFQYRADDQKFGIIDPGTGEFSYTSAQGLLRSFTGYLLVPDRRASQYLLFANIAFLGGALVYFTRTKFRKTARTRSFDTSRSPQVATETQQTARVH